MAWTFSDCFRRTSDNFYHPTSGFYSSPETCKKYSSVKEALSGLAKDRGFGATPKHKKLRQWMKDNCIELEWV